MEDNSYLVRPRLNDYYEIYLSQAEVDFAIPFLDEDIPLYVDPFRLWQSPSYQDNGLHVLMKNTFNNLGKIFTEGQKERAISILCRISECNEVGLGNSKTKNGKKIGVDLAKDVLNLFYNIPAIKKDGIEHIETIQLLVNGISKDRISDISTNLIGSFLIDYTIHECAKYGIPTENCEVRKTSIKS